ncbi:MAG TPA: hypothetical protein VGM17_15160 [Rhizomicrobium sp.]|jgi:hypothetical protein
MFFQPILFFAGVLWAVALTLIGLFMLFRRASHPISIRDRVIGLIAMVFFGLLGAAVLVGIAILLGEAF